MSVSQTNAAAVDQQPPKTRYQGIVVHALHKSASMFLYKFFKRLSERQELAFYSENNAPSNPLTEHASVQSDFCHCPVRTFDIDTALENEFDVQRIFHVRDPRDMLVSEYFSFGWTHSTENTELDERRLEIQKMSIDNYVIGQSESSLWPLEEKFAPLMARKSEKNSELIVQYETMVTNFPKWVSKAIRPFKFRIPQFQVAKLAWRYRNEFTPSADGTGHKRKITPGDFREQLKPKTIQILNDRFADVLERFGYET